jgi:hypothetical protein
LRIEKGFLYVDHHELAWSRRTSSFPCFFLDSQGNGIGEFHAEKKAFRVQIPSGAKYLLTMYWTNSGYPDHILYLLEEPEPKIMAQINREGLIIYGEISPGVKWLLEQAQYDS